MILVTDIQYLAPIIIYKTSIGCKYVYIEQYERWQKTSFRNRCLVPGANGLITLSVPIVGGRQSGGLIRDIKIDNSYRWQMIHWRSVISAYNRSPWFEYFKDEIAVFYHTNFNWLWDWNLGLLEWTIRKLDLQLQIAFTDSWQKDYPADGFIDMRGRVRPQNFGSFAGSCPVYPQVFGERLGFIPNLSIVDLLFCEGPNAANLLKC